MRIYFVCQVTPSDLFLISPAQRVTLSLFFNKGSSEIKSSLGNQRVTYYNKGGQKNLKIHGCHEMQQMQVIKSPTQTGVLFGFP